MPECPYQLSDFSRHEINPDRVFPEEISKRTEKPPPTVENTYSDKISESTTKPGIEGELEAARLKKCPVTWTYPNLTAKSEEHATTKQTLAWLKTKEGQDHLKICVSSCPCKMVKAKLDADTETEANAAAAATPQEDLLKVIIPDCPNSETTEDVFATRETAPSSSVTHKSIAQSQKKVVQEVENYS